MGEVGYLAKRIKRGVAPLINSFPLIQRIQLHIMGRGIKGEGLVKLVNNLYGGIFG